MGKKLKQQRRGKGSNAYTKPPRAFKTTVVYTNDRSKELHAEVLNILNSTGHTAPIMEVMYDDFSKGYLIAPEGISVGSSLYFNIAYKYSLGSVLTLSQIPEGIPIYNIESKPGDGGRYIRSAGSSAKILSKTSSTVSILMPSKKTISLSSECRAQLGVVAGGGMDSLPIMKAGKAHYMNHSINRMWPKNRGVKMDASNHPFGGKNHHKGKSSTTPRNAPPGRKVGHIAARRTGRRKR